MFDLLDSAHALRAALSEYGEQADPQLTEAEFVDLISGLEELKSAAAAAQARASADLATSRERALDDTQGAHDRMAARRALRSVASEVALARRESPHRGSQHLGLAKALTNELPHTYAALRASTLSEWRATLICRETACLSAEDRAEVDSRLAADTGGTEGWGDRQLVNQTRKLTYAVDPHAVVERARKAREDRHVSTRPAPDTMSWLSALLPVEQGVACHAALKSTTDQLKAAGDERSRGQIMADTLVGRITGQEVAEHTDVQVRLTITDRALLQGDSEPAHLEGYGTVPAQWARDLVRDSLDNAKVFVRQVYTHPITGDVVAMASRARTAPKGLADLVATRDQTCRTPWCDAPIRHTDHVLEHAAGGPTAAANLQGLCERCNQTKELPGWRAGPRPHLRHLVVTRTPTGHSYRSTAPPPPGHRPARGEEYHSDLRVRIHPHYASRLSA